MKTLAVSALLFLALTGCTTSERIARPDGSLEYVVACGAAVGWNICYNRANELCPFGYNTVFQENGFNRKELRIACPTPMFMDYRSVRTNVYYTPPTPGY